MVTSSKRTYASRLCCPGLLLSVTLTWRQGRPSPPLRTPEHTQASLTQSLVGSLLLSSGFWCAQGFMCALQESVSPVLWKFCNQIPLTFKVRFHGNSQALCQMPRLGNLLWDLKHSQQCDNFFGIFFSLVYGSPALWLYIGVNGDQEDLCHMPCLPGTLLPEPLSSQQATTDPCLCRRPSNTHRHVCLSLLWGLLLLSLGPGAHKVLFVPSKHLWQVWGLILNDIMPLIPSCSGFFDLLCGYLLLVGYNILLSMVVQQLVVVLVFSQMSAFSSTPPSCKVVAPRTQNSHLQRILKLSQWVQCISPKSSCGWLTVIYGGNLTLRKGKYTDDLWVIGSWLWTDNKLQRWKYIKATLLSVVLMETTWKIVLVGTYLSVGPVGPVT